MIALVTLAGRRWGQTVSGTLVGLPLVSGPVTLFLALDHGTGFAAATGIGILLGTISTAIYCLVYAWLAERWPWGWTLLAGISAFMTATAVLLGIAAIPVGAAVALAVSALSLALWRFPAHPISIVMARAPWWDLPTRMSIATGILVLLTTAAPVLGPHLSGLLAPFPVFITILTTFAHRQQPEGELAGPVASARFAGNPAAGAGAARQVLHGSLRGMFAFVAFFGIIGFALPAWGIPLTFLLATCAALITQGMALRTSYANHTSHFSLHRQRNVL